MSVEVRGHVYVEGRRTSVTLTFSDEDWLKLKDSPLSAVPLVVSMPGQYAQINDALKYDRRMHP